MPLPVMAGIAAASAAYSLYQGISGSRAAKEAGEATADLIRLEAKVARERSERDLDIKTSMAEARSYASGVQNLEGGSNAAYTQAIENYGQEDIRDMMRVARQQARTAEKGGQVTGSGLLAGGIMGAASQAGSAFSYYQQHRSNVAATNRARTQLGGMQVNSGGGYAPEYGSK